MKKAVFFTQCISVAFMGGFSAAGLIFLAAGYVVTLYNRAMCACIAAACVLASALVYRKASPDERTASMRCLPVILPLSMCIGIMLLWNAEWREVFIQIAVSIMGGGYLFRRHPGSAGLKALCRVCCGLLIVPLSIAMLSATLLADFGRVSVVQSLISPCGSYEAMLIDIDEGALGGSTVVDVKDVSRSFDLGFARFDSVKRVYRTGWGAYETMTLSWQDDDTLLIDGHPYSFGGKE